MERYDITIQMLGVEASGPQYVWEKVPAEEGELVLYTDAQATIAALQARVKELEARQHFGACAKCLTNAWRICKEGTPDAVEMKCSNGSTWWLCDYCLSKEQLTQRTAECDALKLVNDTHMKTVMKLSHVVEQRTAELESAKHDAEVYRKMHAVASMERNILSNECADLQAELERVRGEVAETKLYLQQERANRDSLSACVDRDVKTIRELRTLIAALPKVEGAVVVSNGYVKDSTRCHALFGADEDAALYAALLKHRQGMEG